VLGTHRVVQVREEAAGRGEPAAGGLQRRKAGLGRDPEGDAAGRPDIANEKHAAVTSAQQGSTSSVTIERCQVVVKCEVAVRIDQARQGVAARERFCVADRLGRQDPVGNPEVAPFSVRQQRRRQPPALCRHPTRHDPLALASSRPRATARSCSAPNAGCRLLR
jgi:hypothetical protein